MKLPIEKITVTERFRKEMGDMEGLKASIKDVGLLHWIVVTRKRELICGMRRLEACKSLGWESIPVHVVDLDQIAKGELAENTVREALRPTEIEAIRKAIEPVEQKAAKERMVKGKRPSGKLPQGQKGTVREKVGKAVGVSASQVKKIKDVMEAAEQDPEEFGDLPDAMDRKELSVHAAHAKVKKAKQAEARNQVEEGLASEDLAEIIDDILEKLGEVVQLCQDSPALAFVESTVERLISRLKKETERDQVVETEVVTPDPLEGPVGRGEGAEAR